MMGASSLRKSFIYIKFSSIIFNLLEIIMKRQEMTLKIGTKTYPIHHLFSKKLWASILLMLTTIFWFTFYKNDLLAFLESKKMEHITLTQPILGKAANQPRFMFFKMNEHKIYCSIKNENGTSFCELVPSISKIDQAEGILLSYSSEVQTEKKFLLTHLIYTDKNGMQHEFTTSQYSLSRTEGHFDNERILLAYAFLASYIGLILYAVQDWIKRLFSSFFTSI